MKPIKTPFLPRSGALTRYFWATYPLVLLNAAAFLSEVHGGGVLVALLLGVILLTHAVLYLLPPLLIGVGLDFLFSPRLLGRVRGGARVGDAVVYGWVAVGFALVHVLLIADRFILRGYGFHLNAFVWNLVFTRGGIDSLGGSASTKRTAALLVGGIVAAQALLLFLVLRVDRLRSALTRLLTRRRQVYAVIAVAVFTFAQAFAHGVFTLKDYTPALVACEAIPSRVKMTFTSLAESLFGITAPKRTAFRAEAIALRYPLQPLAFRPDRKPLNVVMLVGESWRKDMLDPEIMPATWAFSQGSTRFEGHYSGGHGTRMGIFALFYGLYSPYWDSFLRERRGPVLVDAMVDAGYQFGLFTSATFTYPEFDRTVFARVPAESMHEFDEGEGWECDRVNVGRLVDFIRGRDRARPFMSFLFFESPHARYHFPPECAIRTPYQEDLNYLTMDLGPEGIALVKNRYINSCNHLDTQFARVIECLEEQGLLDSTIVLMTGDHGEEFMEHGRWGHNSNFSDAQTMVPLVLRIPGRAPSVVTRTTNHVDVPATILEALGVTNDPADYSLGYSLFSDRERSYMVLSGLESICTVDAEAKAVFPVGASSIRYGQEFTDRADRRIPGREAYVEAHRDRLVEIMRDLRRFRR